MQRWSIPFDHIENRWTDTQFFCLLAAVNINNAETKRMNERKPNEPGKKTLSANEFHKTLES